MGLRQLTRLLLRVTYPVLLFFAVSRAINGLNSHAHQSNGLAENIFHINRIAKILMDKS